MSASASIDPRGFGPSVGGGETMAGDHPSKTRWEEENVITARAKINRQQDPDLFHFFKNADNIGAATRNLLRLGLAALLRGDVPE
jgi:hypothetical protein